MSIDIVYTQLNVKTVLYQTTPFSIRTVSMSKTVLFQTIQFSISKQFNCKYTVYLSKTFLFQAIQFSRTVLIQTIQFSISTHCSSIQLIDRALSGATIPGQSRPGSNGNGAVLCIPKSASLTGSTSSDCLVSYPEHSLGGVLPLCSGAVGVFYSPNRRSKVIMNIRQE